MNKMESLRAKKYNKNHLGNENKKTHIFKHQKKTTWSNYIVLFGWRQQFYYYSKVYYVNA